MQVGYQADTKWWELVEEADRQLLVGGGPGPGTPPNPGPNDSLEGFGPLSDPNSTPLTIPTTPNLPPPVETPIASLSGPYRSDSTSMRWDVQAFGVEETHPALIGSQPWNLTKQADGVDKFVINTSNAVFASATLTPLDALLAELAWATMDFQRGTQGNARFSTVFAELRLRYCGVHALDPVSLATEARQVLASVAGSLASNITAQDATTLFGDLPTTDQEAILQKMASRSAGNPQTVIGSGRFLEYAPPRIILEFVGSHPELFFDGKCWEDAYGTLDYGIASATQQAQSRVLRHYEALLADAVWIGN